jgi:hypothetical protein
MSRITHAAAKDKGRRLQKWACRKISELTGIPWGKDCRIESRPMGQSGTDVRMDAGVLRLFPFSVECKAQESWSIHQWIEQARNNKQEKTDWLLIAKRNRKKPVVVMDGDAFFKLLKRMSN